MDEEPSKIEQNGRTMTFLKISRTMIVSTVIAAILSVGLAPTTPATAATSASLNDTQITALRQVNSKFNEVVTLQGDFIQTGPQGERAEGRFFIHKPGKIRFEYAPPSQLLVVSNGVWVGVTDKSDNYTDRYPLRTTPLHLLLTKNIDLMQDSRVEEIYVENGLITLVLEDLSADAIGKLTMLFDAQSLDLYQWIVEDAQGLETIVTLTNVELNQPVSGRQFVIPEDKRFDASSRD